MNTNAKLQFYETNGKLFGKIVWLKDPNKNGKPLVNQFNPNDKFKSTPLLGLVFLKNFQKGGEKAWKDGTIYDPNSGKVYASNMKLVSPTQLEVRAYIAHWQDVKIYEGRLRIYIRRYKKAFLKYCNLGKALV